MSLDKLIVKQLAKVAKDSGKLNAAIDGIKDKVINKGKELIEESGVDSSQLPVDLNQYLRGETPENPVLGTPDNVCAMPPLTAQQAENTIRLVTQSQIEIEKIYMTSNHIKSTLLKIQTPINTLHNSIVPIETAVTSLSTAITVIKLIPIPTAVLGIGIPTSVLTTLSSTLDSLDKLLSVAKTNVQVIPEALRVMTKLINTTITKLNEIEGIIDPFLQTLTFVKTVAELRPNCPDVTQEDINSVKDELISSIQGNLEFTKEFEDPNSMSDAELEELLQENSDPGFVYKSFRFVLEYDPDSFEDIDEAPASTNDRVITTMVEGIPQYKRQIFMFPSRRIRCTRANSIGIQDTISGGGSITIFNINPQTNPILDVGAYSYSGDLRILVEEAKFAVDTYNSNITLWQAPQIRENVSGSSDIMVNPDDYTQEEMQEFEEYYGFSPSTITQPLPSYIRYGSNRVNLNNSPTDIEFGADRLLGEGGSSGATITSYIQSGTIQVNKPVNISMKTFGGTGDPTNFYATGFTKSLLTIKRSFSIQDDINPFTGRVSGSEGRQDAIDDFIQEYGRWSIDTLDSIYETMLDVTGEFLFGFNPDGLAILDQGTFKERIEYIFSSEFYDENGFWVSSVPESIIDILYGKAENLLYNEQLYSLSKKLYTNLDYLSVNTMNTTTLQYAGIIRMGVAEITVGGDPGSFELNEYNWYKSARKFNSAQNGALSISQKQAVLGMFLLGFMQFLQTYQNLYGNRTDYNNGAWVGAASTLPIIPTQAGGDNEDITIPIQIEQIVDRNKTLNEIVGGLSLLGTYTYDLEIINSLPAVGGSEMDYPTNYTEFSIETT